MSLRHWLLLLGVSLMVSLQAASFQNFDQKAKDGQSLTVVFLGGSLTWGANASDPNQTSYRALMGQWLKQTYPKAHFTFVDAAIGGTGAQLGVQRLERDVMKHHPDLMFLDFTLNDDAYKVSDPTLSAYESIVRQTLAADCPVVVMITAARSYVEEKDLSKMHRRTKHLELANYYHLPVGDVVQLMQQKYNAGELDLDLLWPPYRYDNTHPSDAGYQIYFEAAKAAYLSAVASKETPVLPEKWLSNDSYKFVKRFVIAKMLPEGFKIEVVKPETSAVAYDFVMSRWLDDMVRLANNKRTGRSQYEITGDAPKLVCRFRGSSVLFFGESTLKCGKYKVLIDGVAVDREFDAGKLGKACNGNAHMVKPVIEGLSEDTTHTLEIIPDFAPGEAQEIRLESICLGGSKPVELTVVK